MPLRKSHFWFIAAAILVVLLIYFVWLRRSQKQILVVGDDGVIRFVGQGQMTFERGNDGRFHPVLVRNGRFVVLEGGRFIFFRSADTTFHTNAKPGEIYRCDEDLRCAKAGEFDLSKTNEQLAKEYGVPLE